MFPARALVKAAPQVRQMSVLSGPPRVRISLAEKTAHGLVITGAILAVPLWVLANIKNYRSHD